jgi:hypothetical protein
MITSDDAHRVAPEAIGPAAAADGQGWQLEEFDAGWFIREDWMSEKSVRGGSFCVVERATGRVLAFPTSISPVRIMTEYDQVGACISGPLMRPATGGHPKIKSQLPRYSERTVAPQPSAPAECSHVESRHHPACQRPMMLARW